MGPKEWNIPSFDLLPVFSNVFHSVLINAKWLNLQGILKLQSVQLKKTPT